LMVHARLLRDATVIHNEDFNLDNTTGGKLWINTI
jgi:hypothetical protein